MRAVRNHTCGEPEVLQVDEIPKPMPGNGQILIKVHAVGVNPIEVYIRQGNYYAFKPELPNTPGHDCAGVVEVVGSGVEGFKSGDRVYSCGTITGAYAEYTVGVPKNICHLPDNFSFAQGAAIGTPYFSAYRAIYQKAKAKPGETVLVHGASGGVGVAAVQLAKYLGLRVLGTVGSESGEEVVRKAGADKVFNHKEKGYINKIKEAAGDKGIDIVVEMLVDVNLNTDMELLNQRGRLVVVGCRGHVEFDPVDAMLKEIAIFGMALYTTPEDEWVEIMEGMGRALKSGGLNPVIGREYPLAEAPQAHRDIMGTQGAKGKLVLIV